MYITIYRQAHKLEPPFFIGHENETGHISQPFRSQLLVVYRDSAMTSQWFMCCSGNEGALTIPGNKVTLTLMKFISYLNEKKRKYRRELVLSTRSALCFGSEMTEAHKSAFQPPFLLLRAVQVLTCNISQTSRAILRYMHFKTDRQCRTRVREHE